MVFSLCYEKWGKFWCYSYFFLFFLSIWKIVVFLDTFRKFLYQKNFNVAFWAGLDFLSVFLLGTLFFVAKKEKKYIVGYLTETFFLVWIALGVPIYFIPIVNVYILFSVLYYYKRILIFVISRTIRPLLVSRTTIIWCLFVRVRYSFALVSLSTVESGTKKKFFLWIFVFFRIFISRILFLFV